METKKNNITRRDFLETTGRVVAGVTLSSSFSQLMANQSTSPKTRLAIVGTGVRACGMFGRDLLREYADYVEIVGLCDINPGRLEYAKSYIGAKCPTFINFEKMITETKPDKLLVTTVDSTHDEFIIEGLNAGIDVITEKPMTTDEVKCQNILDAEKGTGRKVIVTFNYRYSPHRAKIYEILREGTIGEINSVDFNWYLNTEHGPRYMRRWHGLREKSGTLLVHKSTHHFDLLNWWLNSDPEEVFAYGDLSFFGKNNSFRSKKCRGCIHKDKCELYWDITENEHLTKLYVENEQYDGYIRDACVWREEIDIFDKMGVLIKYANGVQVNYSLTTYSPYEGYRLAFNGTKGRLETWIHEKQSWPMENFDELRLTMNFGDTQLIQIPQGKGGHGGGDIRMKDKIFKDPNMPDPFKQSAGTRDGAMSILVGIAARTSIDTGETVQIGRLTEIKPQAVRPS
ncbi:MAG: Gfo/Idh/MocA family oxidoreductase [bacterium]|nr:MAG: Gfo/Idh/MocA family oxidoreductase [bacterium]